MLTTGITDDLFSESEKGEILDDYRNRINKFGGKIIEWYVFVFVYDKAEERG